MERRYRPRQAIPDEATSIHGITNNDVRDAPPWVIGRLGYQAWIRTLIGVPLVAYNAPYDLTIIRARPRYVIDPLVLDKGIDPYRKGSRRLSDVCEHYEVAIGHAHTAKDDAVAAARVAWALCEHYPWLASRTLDQLMVLQRQWKLDQSRDLARYFRATGKDYSEIRADWPIYREAL